MKDLLKDKRIAAIGAIVLVIIVLVAGFLFLSHKTASQTNQTGVDALPTQVPVPTISASDLGFTIKYGQGGKTVIASVANIDGISGIDYELSYTSKGNIPRGAIGSFDLTKKPVSKEITLGTCSDVCHYDQNVSNIKIVLKITKTNGNVFESQATLDSTAQ